MWAIYAAHVVRFGGAARHPFAPNEAARVAATVVAWISSPGQLSSAVNQSCCDAAALRCAQNAEIRRMYGG